MSTKVHPLPGTTQRSAATEAGAASTTAQEAPIFTLSGPITAVPAYLTEKLDEATGELAQVHRQVPPGNPGTPWPQHRLHKAPRIGGRYPTFSGLAGQQRG